MTPEEFYEIAAEGRGADIDAALARFPASARIRSPLAIGLRAMRSVTEGDVPGGIALLKRGIASAKGPERDYLLDLLVPLLINARGVEEAESALASTDGSVPVLIPAFDASRAIVAARQGNDHASVVFAKLALDGGRAVDNPLIVGRVLSRTALAAFYREDFDEAQDRALEAARWYERFESHRNAAMAYSVLYVIAHNWTGDVDVARFYARRMTMSAHLGRDASLENWGLLAQIEIAANAGDARRLRSLGARLRSNPLNEQYYLERSTFVFAEALALGWSGRFDAARAALAGLRQRELSLPERALCESMLAVTAMAAGNDDVSARLARRVISQTIERRGNEPLFEARMRRTARLLAAMTCIVLGDRVRGARALSRAVDPQQRFAALVGARGVAEAELPEPLRGYARFLNEACGVARAAQPPHPLTAAELEIMRALPGGMTLATIASSLGKSRKTVERQVGSIYAKLHVANRAQAIQRARDLGING
jgi:DNA-binding CsgD family transcriptional regulator